MGRKNSPINTDLMKKAIDDNQFTTKEIARRMKKAKAPIHPSSVDNWKRGATWPSRAHAEALAKVLGVKVEDLVLDNNIGPRAGKETSNGLAKINKGLETLRMSTAEELAHTTDKALGSKLGEIIVHLNQAIESIR
jgi:transcriptional regulator with XRE-family HTH domain